MSETLRQQLFGSLRAAKDAVLVVAPGLNNLVPDLKAEFKRQASLGAAELAAALFSGNSFVLYGPNGRATERSPEPAKEPARGPEHDGMER